MSKYLIGNKILIGGPAWANDWCRCFSAAFSLEVETSELIK